MEILIGLLIIALFGTITYINLKEQENLRKENDLIPKEFIGDRND